MRELHDYQEGSVQNNQVIVYESATSLYKPKTIPTILGYTPVPDSRTITINGTTYDLSANRSWTVSANQNARTEYEFTTNGSSATYNAVYSVGQVDVFYNGSKLSSTEFTAINGTSVTLGFTPPSGQLVEVVAWETGGGVSSGRILTINGVSYDLSANRSWTIAGGVTSFNTRTGDITLTSGDVTGALGYTPANGSSYLPLTGGTVSNTTSAGNPNVLTIKNNTNTDNGYAYSTIALDTTLANTMADIRLGSSTPLGIRIYAATSPLTATPTGAGFQLFTNSHPSFSGQVYFDSGSNNNAGLIFRTAQTGGTITTRFRINANGSGYFSNNFTIGGVTDAGFRLDVQGTLRVTGALTGATATFSGTNGVDVLGSIRTDGASNGINLRNGFTATITNPNNNTRDIRFDQDVTGTFMFKANGTMGIGTVSPDCQLVLNGSSNSRLNMRAGDTRYGTFYADAGVFAVASITSIPLVFGTNDIERLRITPSGNVGVYNTLYAINNVRPGDNGYGGVDFFGNGFGYQYAAKFFTFRSPDLSEAYGFTNDYGAGTSAELAMVSKGSTANIAFYTGTSTVAKVKINPSGRMSIGAAAEGALHVAVEGMDDQLVLGSSATNRDIAMHMYSGTTKAEVLRFQSAFRLLIGNGSAITKQSFITGGGERFTIENGGIKMPAGTTLILAGSGADFGNSTGVRMTESYGALWNFGNSATWHHQIINGSSLVGFNSSGGNYGNGNIYATGSITASYSDVRLKRNFIKIPNALQKVCQLNGYTYQHNELGKELLKENPNKVYAGFKAQEVQHVLPEAVTIAPFDLYGYDEMGNPISKSGESYLTINYDRLGVLFVEAIKELKAENDELREILNRNNII
jgi:hypothetical protein